MRNSWKKYFENLENSEKKKLNKFLEKLQQESNPRIHWLDHSQKDFSKKNPRRSVEQIPRGVSGAILGKISENTIRGIPEKTPKWVSGGIFQKSL